MARLVKKPLRAVGLGAVVLCLGAAGYLLLHDEPPPDDSDLMVARKSVPDDKNGFFDVQFEREEVYHYFDVVQGKVVVSSLSEEAALGIAAEIEEENEEVFRRLDVALAKPYFQFPEEDDTPAFVWKGMELSLQACSQLEARAGRVRSAMERALRLVRFGSRVQKGEGPLVSWLFGSQYIHTGIREIEKLIRESRLSVEELRICLTVLELAPDPREELREAMLVEYQRFSALVDSLARGENPGRLPKGWQSFAYRKPLLKAQRMKRRAAEDARRIRALACWPARGRRSAGPRPDFWAKLSLDDLAHDTLWLGEYLDEWLGFADDEVFALSAVRVLAALALHRETHGRLPDSLDELVPEYLREVPRDPYDGNPLRYLPDQGMVYAIGPDLVDRGGLPLTGRGEPDPCFRLDG